MRKFMLMLAVVVVFGMAGCASTSNSVVRKERVEVDKVHVAAVDAVASRRGVQVVWVNPPMKRVAIAAGSRNN